MELNIVMNKAQYLPAHASILKNKTVLDLACHTGKSTRLILEQGAQHVYAVDIRPDLVSQAQQQVPQSNATFVVGDITDPAVISHLVQASNTITCFGVLYHLFDHFRFLSHILKPNIEHVLLETLFGIESLNPEMSWAFESTDSVFNGWAPGCAVIPNGTPNASWILQAAEIFGFRCDWIHCYGVQVKKPRAQITFEEYATVAGPDWPTFGTVISTDPIPEFVEQEIAQLLYEFTARRMILRLYNTRVVNSTPLAIQDIYQWPY